MRNYLNAMERKIPDNIAYFLSRFILMRLGMAGGFLYTTRQWILNRPPSIFLSKATQRLRHNRQRILSAASKVSGYPLRLCPGRCLPTARQTARAGKTQVHARFSGRRSASNSV